MQRNQLEKTLKVIGLLGIISFTSGCDQDFGLIDILPDAGAESGDDGGGVDNGDDGDNNGDNDGGGVDDTPAPATKSNIVEAFEDTLFQDVVTECGVCHGANQQPLFALAGQPLESLKNLEAHEPSNVAFDANYSFADAQGSFLVSLLKVDAHFCGARCDEVGDTIAASITAFANAGEARFASGTSIQADIDAFGATLHPEIATNLSCGSAACHGGDFLPFGSPDVATAYFELQSLGYAQVEDSASTLVAFITAGHFGTGSAEADTLQAGIDAWVADLGATPTPPDDGNNDNTPPPVDDNPPPPANEIALQAFTDNVHPVVAIGICNGCHSTTFASFDVAVSYNASVGLIDIANPANSELANALVDSALANGFTHSDAFCGGSCAGKQQEIINAVTASQ